MPKFKVDLFNPKSIRELQDKLNQYKNTLVYKANLVVQRLIQMGYGVALSHIQESPLGKYIVLSSSLTPEQMGCKAILMAVGEIRDVPGREPFSILMAVEFGAGKYYNPKAHDKAPEFGFGVGTYPDQRFANSEDGWWFMDDDGKWKHTFGVKATMPMYNALKTMKENIDAIVKEVFANG